MFHHYRQVNDPPKGETKITQICLVSTAVVTSIPEKHTSLFSKGLFIIFTIFPMDFLQIIQLFQGTFYKKHNFSKGLFAHYATFF